MSFLESFFLGAIQGLAEFLPISSSGHLAVAKEFLNLSEVPLLYDIILHLATLLAVVLVYHKTIWRLITVAVRFVFRKTDESDKEDLRFILAIIVATFFTGLLGILLKDVVENLHVKYISLLFVVTGFVLLFSDKIAENKNRDNTIKLRSAVIVGVVQGIAVFPGISRSGSTMAAGLFSGISRNKVAEFSFILSIPAILGALVLQLVGSETLKMNVTPFQLAIGFLTAFVTGVISLKLLTELLKKAKTKIFSFYLIPMGIILFCYFTFWAV